MENSMVAPQKLKNRISIWSSNSTSGYICPPKLKARSWGDICTPIFIVALFTIVKTWKPRCPSVNESSSVQSLSRVWLLATPWTTARQASLSITNFQSLPKLMSIESVMPSNHLILCHPLLFLPSIFPNIRVFSNASALRIRWTIHWSFSFNISPSKEHPGLISFRMDWLDLLEVQGTLKSLLQHHSSKASILWCSTFFVVQLSHPYKTTGTGMWYIHIIQL